MVFFLSSNYVRKVYVLALALAFSWWSCHVMRFHDYEDDVVGYHSLVRM